jgi:hypothetical protein
MQPSLRATSIVGCAAQPHVEQAAEVAAPKEWTMRYIAWNLALSAWLLISAFAFGHTAESAAANGLLAVLIGCIAVASPGRPGLRLANSGLAFILGWASLLMQDVSGIARINSAIVAAIVFALSIVPGRSTGTARAAAQPKA